MWAIDQNALNFQRLLESMRGLLVEHANDGRVNVAFTILAVDGSTVDCDKFVRSDLTVTCHEVAALPQDTAKKFGCKRATDPVQPLFAGEVHIIRLAEGKWGSIFEKTVDKFAALCEKGQPSEQGEGWKRPELIKNRANHLRFIADRIFLPMGVEHVLYLDNDICPVGAVNDLMLTQGSSAVVVASRVDENGQVVETYDKENIKTNLNFVKKWRFKYSFNAGVVLFRTQAMCEYNLMGKILEVQMYHNNIRTLWRKGTNQPPFEIAAGRSLTIVDPWWNCRMLNGDVSRLLQYGNGVGSPMQWIKNCKLFHPSTHGLSIGQRNCSLFKDVPGGNARPVFPGGLKPRGSSSRRRGVP